MPKVPSIYFKSQEFKKLKERVKLECYPLIYAYIKDLVLKDLKE